MCKSRRQPDTIACALLLFVGFGCGGYHPLNRTALRSSRPQTLGLARGATPHFAVSQSTWVAPVGMSSVVEFALIVSVVAVMVETAIITERGDEVVRKHRIEDPSPGIGAVLAQDLLGRYSLRYVGGVYAVDSRVPSIGAQLPGADLILDVRTANWGIAPAGSDHYGVTYRGSLRLIDRRSKTVLAEGECEVASQGNETY